MIYEHIYLVNASFLCTLYYTFFVLNKSNVTKYVAKFLVLGDIDDSGIGLTWNEFGYSTVYEITVHKRSLQLHKL